MDDREDQLYWDSRRKMGDGDYLGAIQGFEKCISDDVEARASIEEGILCAILENDKSKFLEFCKLGFATSSSVGIDPEHKAFLPENAKGSYADQRFWKILPSEWQEDYLSFMVNNRFNMKNPSLLRDYVRFFFKEGEYEIALDLGLKCLDILDEGMSVLYFLGLMCAYQNRTQDAVRVAERVHYLEEQKNDISSWHVLANLHALNENREKAKSIFSELSYEPIHHIPFNFSYHSEDKVFLRKNRRAFVNPEHWLWKLELLHNLDMLRQVVELFVEKGEHKKANHIIRSRGFVRYMCHGLPLFERLELAIQYSLDSRPELEERMQNLAAQKLDERGSSRRGKLIDRGLLDQALSEELSEFVTDKASLSQTMVIADLFERKERINDAVDLYESKFRQLGPETTFCEASSAFQYLARLHFKTNNYSAAAAMCYKDAKHSMCSASNEASLHAAAKLYLLAGDKSNQIQILKELEMILVNSGRAEDIALIYQEGNIKDDFERISTANGLDNLGSKRKAKKTLKGTSPRTKREQNSLTQCPDCGEKNIKQNKFCTKCGFPLSAARAQCSKCGNNLKADDMFCGKCGTKRII